MCTVLLPPGVNPIAVKYIISYHISYHIISYHIISYHIISYHIILYRFKCSVPIWAATLNKWLTVSLVSSLRPAKCCDSTVSLVTITSFRILSNSFFNMPFIHSTLFILFLHGASALCRAVVSSNFCYNLFCYLLLDISSFILRKSTASHLTTSFHLPLAFPTDLLPPKHPPTTFLAIRVT